MGVKDTLVRKGFLPDIGALTDQLNEKFAQLLAELQGMHQTLNDILAAVRAQSGATT